jgi:hypothetical protein
MGLAPWMILVCGQRWGPQSPACVNPCVVTWDFNTASLCKDPLISYLTQTNISRSSSSGAEIFPVGWVADWSSVCHLVGTELMWSKLVNIANHLNLIPLFGNEEF